MLDTIGAFIGEFDALDGPKVTYAFEHFDFSRVAKGSAAVCQLLCFVEGDVLLGKSVASGLLHLECREYLNCVAAHVLTSNESREERLLYQESGCPCVGSFLFSLPDIVARGEKRRFCLIFLHPSYHELVARWDDLSAFVAVLLTQWTQRATSRYQAEYDTLKNLEQLREESRRKPLRPLTQLLACPSPCTAAAPDHSTVTLSPVFEELHCYFEIILPQVFSQPIPLVCSDQRAAYEEAERRIGEQMLLVQSSIDRVNVELRSLKEGEVVLPRFAKQLILVDSEIVVRPLAVWLLEFLSDAVGDAAASREACRAVHALLRALFSGNQIIISGDDARDCASLAMALSYLVPPPLAKVHVGSSTYRMPYESRVLSFSQQALGNYVFAETPASANGADAAHLLRLFDMEADGIVHVRVLEERIAAIHDCDQLRHAVHHDRLANAAPAQAPHPTTLENRILTLLSPYLVPVAGACAIHATSLQLVTTQMHQLVSEYVVRGRVYLQLFAQQEVEANARSLTPTPLSGRLARTAAQARTATASLPMQHGSSPLGPHHGEVQQGRPQLSGHGDASLQMDRSTASLRQSEDHHIRKHAHLSPLYGKQFQHSHYVFSSFAPEDHAVLVFLGSA